MIIVNDQPEKYKLYAHTGSRPETNVDHWFRRMRYSRIMAEIKPDSIVCDIGCGDGSLLKLLSSRIRKGIGLDARIDARKQGNIEYKSFDFCNSLPLEDSSVDAVVMLAVLEHVPDFELAFQEVARVLRPGGIFLATTPSPASKPLLEFLSFKLNIVDPREIADHKRYVTTRDLRQESQKVGLEPVQCNTFQFGFNNFLLARKK